MPTKTIFTILKLSCFFVFAGRAYKHLFWDAPFRSLLWDQTLLEPVVNILLGMEWQAYVTNLSIDSTIQLLIRVNGFFYLACAIISLLMQLDSKKWKRIILLLGGINLILLSLLLTKDKFYHLGMFFEHAIQFGLPFALLGFMKHQSTEKLVRLLKWLTASTFICHGIYALGTIYPLPANFVTMTLNVLPIEEPTAKNLLFTAGILDFIAAGLLFIPKTAKPALIYAGVWGLLTAFARIISGCTYGITFDIFHQYMYLVIYRLPHGIVPLLIYLIASEKMLNFDKQRFRQATA